MLGMRRLKLEQKQSKRRCGDSLGRPSLGAVASPAAVQDRQTAALLAMNQCRVSSVWGWPVIYCMHVVYGKGGAAEYVLAGVGMYWPVDHTWDGTLDNSILCMIAHYNTLNTDQAEIRSGKQDRERESIHVVVVVVDFFAVLSSTSLRILPTCSSDPGADPFSPASTRLCSLRSHLAALFSSRAASRSSRTITGGRWSIGVPNGATIRSTTWCTVRLLGNPDANSITSPSRSELRGSATKKCVTLG